MTVPNKTPTRATRKTVITGESAPELTTEFRPIPLGIDRQGDPSGQIRAFAVAVRNRSDGTVWVKESDESDPIPIERFESYNIWETNGISEVYLKGDSGGETVELRLLVAHNDFDVTDKIDAFVRAINHFLTQNKQETVITDSETTFNVDGNVTVDDITTGTVSIDEIADGIDIDSGLVNIGDIDDTIAIESGTVTIDDITNSSTTLDVAGNVTVDDIVSGTVDIGDGNVTVDDITATSANFDGDITGQSDFDLSAVTREGQTESVRVDGTMSVGYQDADFGEIVGEYAHYDIVENADNDGFISRIWFRATDTQSPESLGFKVEADYNDGEGYRQVSPLATLRAEFAIEEQPGDTAVECPQYDTEGDVVIVWEPTTPVRWQEGDSVAVTLGPHGTTAGDGTARYELDVIKTEVVKQ